MCRSSSKTECLGAHGLTSNTLLQRASLNEFTCVAGLFELTCWVVPLAAVGRGGQELHPSDSCGVNFIKISFDIESQLEIVSEVPKEFIQFSPDERPLPTPSWVRSTASTRAVSSKGGVPAPPTSRPCRCTCEVDYGQFWTSSEAHAHCRKSSEWIQVWQ